MDTGTSLLAVPTTALKRIYNALGADSDGEVRREGNMGLLGTLRARCPLRWPKTGCWSPWDTRLHRGRR